MANILRVPQEGFSGSMTPPHSLKRSSIGNVWRPNNYRRQIGVKPKDKSAFISYGNLSKHYRVKYSDSNKILTIKNYMPNITIQYAKKTLTAIYSQNKIGKHKEVYLIKRDTIREVFDVINKKRNIIESKLDNALYSFIQKYKIGIPGKKPIWSRYEDFIKGEEYIDSIPEEVVIHDTFFKKVYPKGIEFKSTKLGEVPTIHMKNYIKYRAIEDVSPMIAEEIKKSLDTISNRIDKINLLKYIKDNTHHISDLIGHKSDILLLSRKEREELSQWSFAKFGVV